jgi:hypothetical protein
MGKNPLQDKKTKKTSTLPKTLPVHEEPLRGIEPGKMVCEICGKTFVNKGQIDRHMLNMHESPEGRE